MAMLDIGLFLRAAPLFGEPVIALKHSAIPAEQPRIIGPGREVPGNSGFSDQVRSSNSQKQGPNDFPEPPREVRALFGRTRFPCLFQRATSRFSKMVDRGANSEKRTAKY